MRNYNINQQGHIMESKREKVIHHLSLMNDIRVKSKINIVLCNKCGTVLLHKIVPLDSNEPDTVECFSCGHKNNASDAPDVFYDGMENSALFEE